MEVSPTFIANITEAVMEEVPQWQTRPLDAISPIVSVDCLVVKGRENQRVLNKALYLALGVDLDGQKELLGMWMFQNEGAKFWLAVFTELPNRGLKDLFVACMDGRTGLPEAVETLSPQTRVQLCLVHMVRNSLDMRKVIDTTNAIESVTMSLRKVTRNHRIFPSDEAAFKVVYLALQNIAKKWTMPIHNWKSALNCFAIEFAGRLPQ